MNIERAPTLKRMPPNRLIYLSVRGASPADQTRGALFFSPILPISVEKASNATIKLQKDISRANIPIKIEMIP